MVCLADGRSARNEAVVNQQAGVSVRDPERDIFKCAPREQLSVAVVTQELLLTLSQFIYANADMFNDILTVRIPSVLSVASRVQACQRAAQF